MFSQSSSLSLFLFVLMSQDQKMTRVKMALSKLFSRKYSSMDASFAFSTIDLKRMTSVALFS